MEVQELEEKIKKAQDSYYNDEESIMSDNAFDEMWDELQRKDPNNPILHRVGEDGSSGFKKVRHVMHMFSQEKARNHEEFMSWAKNHYDDDWLVELKCDGSSIELQYENGQFVRAVSRGNGEIGDDITENISKASGYRKVLTYEPNFTGAVRGEVLIYHDTFNQFCKGKANCRNAANGIMKRKHSEEAHLLNIVFYDVFRSNPVEEYNFREEIDKIRWLEDSGFTTVQWYMMNDPNDVIELRDRLASDRFQEIPYDIDGIVIKCNRTDLEDVKRDRPEKQIAFKFALNEQPTTVRGVEWSVAGATRTPVAICDPVYLCGTTVTRASLANIDLITKTGLKIGSRVMMVKRGEIIPKIETVIKVDYPLDTRDIEIPTTCQFCGTPLKLEGPRLFCPNKMCSEVQKHRILNWSRVNKIYCLGPAIVSLLFDKGVVTSVISLYQVTVGQLSQVISPKVAIKIRANIDKTKEMDLAHFVGGYDLEGIGVTTVENICRIFPETHCLRDLLNIPFEKLANAQGFGELSARNIIDQLNSVREELEILEAYVKIKLPRLPVTASNLATHLMGKSVAFTGPLKTMSRDEAKQKVRECGGRVTETINNRLDYLVTNEASNSRKFIQAQKLGVHVIDEERFRHLLEGTW